MIKWEHSVLTLPFGLTGAVLAARGIPNLHTSIWIVVALVAARSAAMAFNRLADATIDAANPRTKIRALPAGKLSKSFVAWFVVVTSAILIFAAYELNPLAFYLSPVALAHRVSVFVHQALHALVARGAGPGDGHCAGRRLDRGARLARSANPDPDRSRGLLGRGLRHPLCLPGLRPRLLERGLFRAEGIRHSHGARASPGCFM